MELAQGQQLLLDEKQLHLHLPALLPLQPPAGEQLQLLFDLPLQPVKDRLPPVVLPRQPTLRVLPRQLPRLLRRRPAVRHPPEPRLRRRVGQRVACEEQTERNRAQRDLVQRCLCRRRGARQRQGFIDEPDLLSAANVI